MNPRLIAIAGELLGTTFAVTDSVSVGRDAANDVCLADSSVSRRHCLVRCEGGLFRLVDLDSFNGTLVNGIPVKEKELEHGDQILVGNTLLLFLTRQAEDEMPLGQVQLQESNLVTLSTVRLRSEDALYLKPDAVLSALPSMARFARDLKFLLGFSRTVAATKNLEDLQGKLLESLLDAIPAERGAVVLMRDDSEEPLAYSGRDRRSATTADRPVEVSWTVARQVLRDGLAVMSNDVQDDKSYGVAESLINSSVRSLLCVPLTLRERPSGFIYLDTSNTTSEFDEGHLHLLVAAAAVASLAFENILHVNQLHVENRRLRDESGIEHNMVGNSARMQQVYKFIARVALADSTVLIRGESGTGKELAAHAVHRNSPRRDEAFVAINCATLAENLLESELFGHERGAFTGAVTQKKGKLEVAHRGTVFLDEVGELPLPVQAKLLRVLQEREFERLGSNRLVKIDVRVIAATNKDLEEAVGRGSFRKDLFYRINVVALTMPALSERRDDIPLLANYFISKYSKKCKRKVSGISPEASDCLIEYNWPGNVRELENAVEHAIVLGTTERIEMGDLPDAVIEGRQSKQMPANKFYQTIVETKKQLILDAIEQANGNRAEAAQMLGVHPNNLSRLIRTLGLKPPPTK
jgi:transcriptional regulator with GAF, ATPase, and Fis domain